MSSININNFLKNNTVSIQSDLSRLDRIQNLVLLGIKSSHSPVYSKRIGKKLNIFLTSLIYCLVLVLLMVFSVNVSKLTNLVEKIPSVPLKFFGLIQFEWAFISIILYSILLLNRNLHNVLKLSSGFVIMAVVATCYLLPTNNFFVNQVSKIESSYTLNWPRKDVNKYIVKKIMEDDNFYVGTLTDVHTTDSQKYVITLKNNSLEEKFIMQNPVFIPEKYTNIWLRFENRGNQLILTDMGVV